MKARSKTGLKTAAEVAAESGKDFQKEVEAKASEGSSYTPPKGWLKVEAQADHVRMTISGPIGASIWDDSGTNSKVFCEALNNIDETTPVRVHINSEGGSVHQALEIYNALKARSNVTTCIDGVALSAASIIALGGDPVVSPQSSVWMIHSPRVGTFGDSEEHKRSLKMLDAFRSSMADVYASETGQDKDELLALMDAETWFTGAEAVDFGLADQLQDDDEETEAAFARASTVLAMYRPPENIRQLLSTGQSARGVAGTAASKSKTENTMKENTPTQAAATTPPAAQQQDNPDLRRFIEERKARITAEVRRRAEGRIKNDNLQWWIDQAIASDNLAGEQAVYDQIEAMPLAAAAEGAPIARDAAASADASVTAAAMPASVGGTCYSRTVDKVGHIVEVGVAPDRSRPPFAMEIRRLRTPGERCVVMKREWAGLLNHCIELDTKAAKAGHMPVAANTYSSTLITDYLVDQSVTILTNTWAALSCFTRDFSVDRYKPLATGQIKFVTAGATTLVGSKSANITNFESGDSTTVPITVPMSHYSQPFHVGQDELMSGQRLENLTTINLAVLANTIMAAALAPISAGARNSSGNLVAFSAGTYFASSSSGTFGWATDLPRLRSYLKKSPVKNAILDGSFYSWLQNSPLMFQQGPQGSRGDRVSNFGGWSEIQENTVWPSSPSNIGGFVCNPQAIGVVAGLPLLQPNLPGNVLTETVIQIPGPDVFVANYMWFSLASRTLWSSYDLVFGAAGGDATAGAILFDGAGPRS